MSDNYGSGTSRVLDPKQTGYLQVIWQQGKPPLDSELNFLQQLENDWRQQLVLRGVPSGWFGNETNPSEEFITNANWSNWFRFGRQRTGESRAVQWAAVNGWLVPVTGTHTGTPPGLPDNTDTWNKVTLDPPPSNSGDFRVDFVFLEVWLARVPPGSSTLNKPSASAVYRYGNVEGGYSFIADDIQDPAIGFETTERVQVQYRVRVVKGLIGLATYPDGFDPTVVFARGAASSATSFTFANMRQTLGDPGLWRAGDGTANNALGTVDGYVYAIPISGVFRRNSVVWTGDPSQNLNGGFNRNPIAVDRTGIASFSTTPTLASGITATQTTLTLTSATNIPMPASPATAVLIQVGDELMTYTGITGTTVTGVTRGVQGTLDEAHLTGMSIKVISGRPDGLFSDQIAQTDILDLRHIVNPNGFNYDTLLKNNLDKLVRGQLRSNWKRSGGGPQGPFIFYQDKISASAAGLGITKVDAPDGIREVFSDAAVQQKVEVLCTPFSAPVISPTSQPVGTAWSLTINANTTSQKVGAQWSAEAILSDGSGDVIVIPIAQFKNTVPGADADQIRFVNDAVAGAVSIRLDGQTTPISPSRYVVTPANPGPGDDLTIRFVDVGAPFPTPNTLYITVNVLYGAGRGLSRRPDSIHQISLFNPSSELLVQPTNTPSNNYPLRASWALLWSKYRNAMYKNLLPVTAEAFADLGSKTVVLTPWRRIEFPATPVGVRTMDGTGINVGVQGLMPLLKLDGITPKWSTTDPLGLFLGTTMGDPTLKDIYVQLPRHVVPGWGAVYAPILPGDGSIFNQGINYMLQSKKGLAVSTTDLDHNKQYINYTSNAPLSFASFSTGNFSGVTIVPATYNSTFSYSGVTQCGSRFFTDQRGLGRQGIELPPFYGAARIWAVYEAADYKANGSAFNSSDRTATGGGAKNLLRQNFTGPTVFIEIDDDGDSTFVLNAEALDLTKSTTPIPSFTSKHYVVEASIFGFDRGSFDLTQPFRLILSRSQTVLAPGLRSANINVAIPGPTCILPGPAQAADTALINYSRTPYSGDPWGSQSNYLDYSYVPGSVQSATAYQITSSVLDVANLTRPNQKALEVLASIGFVTTLGTGRLSGDLAAPTDLDFRNVGYEDPTAYPPTSGVQPRPKYFIGALSATEGEVNGEYLGCTERLPIGALRRDKDFRGGQFEYAGNNPSAFVYVREEGVASFIASLAKTKKIEQDELNLLPSSVASGQPGEVLVSMDGEAGNYSLLTNFRTLRGGSVFSGAGSHPGGEVYANYRKISPPLGHTNIIVGRAFLVRNAPTNVGASEVSAGDELMMLVTTTAYNIAGSGLGAVAFTAIGSNGTGEGISSSDLYRIEGHPLMSNNVRYDVDPNGIALSNATTLGVY